MEAMTSQFPVYVINLPSSTDRLERIERLLTSLGTGFEVVPAIFGADLPESELRKFDNFDQMDLGPGEYGCLLSHVTAWKRLIASGEDYAFVLEDDLHFAQTLDPKWLQALPADNPWVLKLETFGHPITIRREAVASFGKRGIYELLSDHGGTGSYAISRAGAQFLLARYRQMQRAIDTEMFSPNRRTIDVTGMAIYQMVPAPCLQDMFLPPNERDLAVASTIGADRADNRELKRQALGKRLMRQARKLIGPIYRKAYSLALMPQGLARVNAKFR